MIALTATGTNLPRLLYVVTEDWAFLSHRLPMARAAPSAIEEECFILHPTPFARGNLSPLPTLKTIAALRRVPRGVRPAPTDHVALQACVSVRLRAGLSQRR
jgi:hypothetical protein